MGEPLYTPKDITRHVAPAAPANTLNRPSCTSQTISALLLLPVCLSLALALAFSLSLQHDVNPKYPKTSSPPRNHPFSSPFPSARSPRATRISTLAVTQQHLRSHLATHLPCSAAWPPCCALWQWLLETPGCLKTGLSALSVGVNVFFAHPQPIL